MRKTYINGKKRGKPRSVLAFALTLCMFAAYTGFAPTAAYADVMDEPSASVMDAAAQTLAVDSVAGLEEALDIPTVAAITLTEEFYEDTDSRETPITIGGIHEQHITITGDEDKAITAAGLYISTGAVTLKNVNVNVTMGATNVSLMQWAASSNYYGAGIFVGEVRNVTIESCDVYVTNTAGPAFTAGVLSRAYEGLTVNDCEITATGKSSTAAILIFILTNDTVVTGNKLSATHVSNPANAGEDGPASALFINRLYDVSNSSEVPAGFVIQSDIDFSGNELDGKNIPTDQNQLYSFYVNAIGAADAGIKEMMDAGFASYVAPGLRPWITDGRVSSLIHRLITSLAEQSGNGYGYVAHSFNRTNELKETYDIIAGKVEAIDFQGKTFKDGSYNASVNLRGRVDKDGIVNGNVFHFAKTVTAAAIKDTQTYADGIFVQDSFIELTYSAIQTGGVDGKAITEGIKITFNKELNEATAAAIGAYFVTEDGYKESALSEAIGAYRVAIEGDKKKTALTEDGDGNAKTWLISTGALTFSNGESVKVDLFGIPGYPVTTGIQEVTLYSIVTEDGDTTTAVVEPEAPTVDNTSGVAAAEVTASAIAKAIKDAEAVKSSNNNDIDTTQIKIEVPKATGAAIVTGVAVSLPKDSISAIAESEAIDKLVITTETGDFEIDSAALTSIAAIASGSDEKVVTLSIKKESEAALPGDSNEQMAGAAVFDISAKAGSTPITRFGDGNTITVRLPYELKEGEVAENVRVYYISGSGITQRMGADKYDSAAGKISFPTNHFSLFTVMAGDPEIVSITATDNLGLTAGERGAVTVSAILNPDDNIVSEAHFSFNLTDGAFKVNEWTTFFDENKSTITFEEQTTSLAAWLSAGTQRLAGGDAMISLVPKPGAAGHAFTYSVTVSKGDVTKTSNAGALKVADPSIEKIEVADNTSLAVGEEGAVTFSSVLSPGGVMTGIEVGLNLYADGRLLDWKTYFDEDKSTIKYGSFDAISLGALTANPADLYLGEATITLVPKPAASGRSFTYSVTVTKGNVTKGSNVCILKVSALEIVTAEPETPTVDDDGIAGAEVTGGAIAKAIEAAKSAKAKDGSIEVEVRIDVPEAEVDAKGVSVSLPASSVSAIAASGAVDKLIISTEAGDFEIGKDALGAIAKEAESAETVTLVITNEEISSVNEDYRSQMSGASVFDVTVKVDDKPVTMFGGSKIKVSLPYTLKDGESSDTVKAYYVPDNGAPQQMADSKYENAEDKGKVSFTTDHLSYYCVMSPVVPSAPQGFTAAPGDGHTTLSWIHGFHGGSDITKHEVKIGEEDWIDASGDNSHTFTGLTNGTAYTFQVRAVNTIGQGAAVSVTTTPRTVPAKPQGFTVTAGHGSATLSWDAPLSSGGGSITGYEVQKDSGEWVSAQIADGYTFTGLTNGTTYTFRVRAVSAVGGGEPAHVTATPRTVPTAPQNFIATPGAGAVTLSWAAPIGDGGSPVTKYQVRQGSGAWVDAGGVTGHTIAGLSNGMAYTFSVRAVNAIGNGEEATAAATPRTVPTAPQGFTATPGDESATLSWSAPISDGGSLITKYQVQSGDGVWVDVTGMAYTFTGLADGAAYTFSVRAVNVIGSGEIALDTVDIGVRSLSITGAPKTFSYKASGKGNTVRLTASIAPAGAALVRWVSSNTSVATVDANGLVTFKNKEGNVTITAAAGDVGAVGMDAAVSDWEDEDDDDDVEDLAVSGGSGKTASVTIRVSKNVTSISTPLAGVSIQKGKSLTLPVALTDNTAPGAHISSKLTWKSSNNKVLRVSGQGKITANKNIKKKTTVKVTVTAANGKSLTIKVTVMPRAVNLSKLEAKFPKAMKAGGSYQLKVDIGDATGVNLTYRSSNNGVIKVNKAGKLSALKKGKVTVTIEAGKKIIKKKITVSGAEVSVHPK